MKLPNDATRRGITIPIHFQIDHDRRIVMARCVGTMTDRDVFDYQRSAWSGPETTGYDEIMDMSETEDIAVPSAQRVRDLATVSAGMDTRVPTSKFAIVAPGDLAYGLGRMYQAYRQLDERSTKQVAVFRTMEEARQWIGSSGSAKIA
jgi:hypothetical protein